jgi:hypothetical protein
MRKINTRSFHVATRTSSRDLNRHIALNLSREHQRIPRGNLARRMNLICGVVSVLVHELIAQEAIHEGAAGEAARGRKPTLLRIRTHDRPVSRERALQPNLSDALRFFRPASGNRKLRYGFLDSGSCERPRRRRSQTAEKTGSGLNLRGHRVNSSGDGRSAHRKISERSGVGVARCRHSHELAAATGLAVHIENSGRASGLAQLWLPRGAAIGEHNFVYISVADGVGTSVAVKGKLLRRRNQIAGGFGPMPLNLEGPLCMCGNNGCREAYASHLAILSCYFGWNLSKDGPKRLRDAERSSFTVLDMIARTRSGDAKAMAAALTGRQPGPAEL